MPRHIGRTVVFLSLLTLSSSASYAAQPWRDVAVTHALDSLDEWLSPAPTADGWRKYLLLDDLRKQVGLGDRADATQVQAVLDRLSSGKPGLDLPQFARLRKAVAAWHAQLTAPTLEQLPELVRKGGGHFQPVDAARLSADRAAVVKAAAQLDKFLAAGPSGPAWRKHLQLDAVAAQLRNRCEVNIEPLRGVLDKLHSPEDAGLDLPQFTALTQALGDWVESLEQSRAVNGSEEYEKHIKALADSLDAYVKEPSTEHLKPVGATLDWLSTHRQAPAIVEAVEQRLSQPNMYLSVSGKFLGDGLNRKIDQTRPVRDNILGTTIVGSGHTVGDLKFRLLPDADQARIEAALEGVNYSRNTGYNGPAIIWTAGNTHLTARKLLTVDADGFHGEPAEVSAEADTHITGIGSSKQGFVGCIVKKVATKKVAEQKGNAEQVASSHAERELRRQFEAQVARELGKTNRQYQERFRNPLVHRGHLPDVYFSSGFDTLSATVRQANGPQLAAHIPAPPVVADPHVSLRLHESLVNNFTAGVLAGETVGQAQLEKFALDLLGEIPERLKDDQGREPWSITFADEDPVTFRVSDGGFEFTGRGKKYTTGDRAFRAMDFTVKYKIEKWGQGVKATRIGDIEIFPPGFVPGSGKRLSIQQTTLRNLMSKRLERMFEPEIIRDGPTDLKGPWQAAGPLEVVDLNAENGWLRLGWRQRARPENTAAKPTDSAASVPFGSAAAETTAGE